MALQINSQYGTNVKYVNKKINQDGQPYTTFSVSDKVKGNGEAKYKYYSVTVWNEDLDIQDGDKVVFTSITGLSSYIDGKGQIKDCFTATVSVVKSDAPAFAQEAPPQFYQPQATMPTFKEEKPKVQEFISVDDTQLPWDLT